MTPLKQLAEQGQSVWIDYLSRRLVHDGDLAGLVRDGVVGVADGQMPRASGRSLPRLDLRKSKPHSGLGPLDMDQFQPFELLRLALRLAGRAGLGPVLGDERFQLPALGERGGVHATIMLAPPQ